MRGAPMPIPIPLVLLGCASDPEVRRPVLGDEPSVPAAGSDTAATADTAPEIQPEIQPEPAGGVGLSDPPTNTLHNACGGTDWQRIHGWVLHPHRAPVLGPPDEIARCVERYAGWVTNEADAAGVSRASVYAALAATGQCDADHDWDGAVLSEAQCLLVHPELDGAACVARMRETRAFGISTLAVALGHPDALAAHASDVPQIGAWAASGTVACGGDDPWRLLAPPGFVERYVAAYDAYKALSEAPPSCAKRIVVSVALYTGLDTPGVDGVAPANGCWTYERVAKENAEWKICGYDGSVSHEDGWKWAYDDTNTAHDAALELDRIGSCQSGAEGRGYVYMVNRGDGWPERVTDGVDVHFAEIYSGQLAIDDQFGLWQSSGEPGDPMIHLGEASTDEGEIAAATGRACAEVDDGGHLGVYVYPESLRGSRMSALVGALNACTGL